ncbi:HDOD domain protein [Symmachiella dynata]|uniref:HDOD domain protein n=1 Tax=Symmachiella dynata TaxID=2527995 RepID=A0A517ZM88_9PLAN|nr:HDOD domain-containing protein [Symmachiella dynata]QDU43582.1 HDOD domain protein [Symmachiella dynata]
MSDNTHYDRQAINSVLDRVNELHSLPQVAISILNLTRDIDYDVREVVACLENDPGLAAKILRTINSSRYGLRREVTNLRQAVALLGQRSLRLVAMTFSLVDGLSRGSASRLCQEYWRRSISMATLSSRLAKRTELLDHNDAYSGGLLADLGVLVLAQVKQDEYVDMALKTPHGPELLRAEQDKYGFTHAQLGAQLLTRWGFPETLVQSTQNHHDDINNDNKLQLVTHAGCLMAEVLWTPDSPQFPAARKVLEERFNLTTDDIIDLVVGTKADVEFNAGLFGVTIDGEIDIEAIRQRAATKRTEVFAETAAELANQATQDEQEIIDAASTTEKRHLGTMVIKLYRDSDPMRTGIICEFENISPSHIELRLPLPVSMFEQVKVHLHNEVQAFDSVLRGTVRETFEDDTVFSRLDIELHNRISSFDLTALENAGLRDKPVKGPVWI